MAPGSSTQRAGAVAFRREDLQRSLGRTFVLGEVMGQGAYGAVYRAYDRRLDRHVAVKALRSDVPVSPRRRRRFEREARIIAGLRHPHVIPIYWAGGRDDALFMVMPLIEGGSLADLFDTSTSARLSVEEGLRIATEVADGLEAAHRAGVVHKDVKPENILLDGEGRHAVLTDFGIAIGAHLGSRDTTGDDAPVGTPAYMSPEQVAGDPVGARSDLYSLGCVLFRMLTGEAPFRARTPQLTAYAHVMRDAPSLTSRGVFVPQAVEAVVARCLQKDPSARYSSAAELRGALHRARGLAVLAPGVDVSAQAGNCGRMVSRLCNRWEQVNSFDAFLRTSTVERPGKPLILFVEGPEGEAHTSLVERLVNTRLPDFLHARGFGNELILRFNVPWPRGSELGILQRDLSISIFRELTPDQVGPDLSVDLLTVSTTLQRASAVVVEHDVRSRYWNRATEQLLLWYADEFWGSSTRSSSSTLWIVFVKVIDERGQAKNLISRLISRGSRSRWSGRVAESMDRHCPTAVLSKLGRVTADDVKDWFMRNRVYDTEDEWLRLSESIFAGASALPMAVVESALAEIHESYVAAQGA